VEPAAPPSSVVPIATLPVPSVPNLVAAPPPAAPLPPQVSPLPEPPPVAAVPSPAVMPSPLLAASAPRQATVALTPAAVKPRTVATPLTRARKPAQPAPARSAPEWPLGSQSVLAAYSGMPTQVAFMPAPIVTMPLTPPLPPPLAKIPEPPQPIAYGKAATAAAAARQAWPAAAASMMPAAPYGLPQQAAWQGYGANPNYLAQAGGMAPYGQPGPLPNPYPNPYVQQARMVQPYPPSFPAGPAEQMARVLRESPYPPQREWAVQALTGIDSRLHPQILPILLLAATHDPAPSVRLLCVRCLPRLAVAPSAYMNTLQALRADADPYVRQEAEQICSTR
jgi:hypothetical protein